MIDFSVFDFSFNDSATRGVEAESGIPFLWPCGEKQQFTRRRFLKQHLLKAYHSRSAAVVVGCPIKARVPESREPIRTAP